MILLIVLSIAALLLIMLHPTGRASVCSLAYAIFFLVMAFCALVVTGMLMIFAAGAY